MQRTGKGRLQAWCTDARRRLVVGTIGRPAFSSSRSKMGGCADVTQLLSGGPTQPLLQPVRIRPRSTLFACEPVGSGGCHENSYCYADTDGDEGPTRFALRSPSRGGIEVALLLIRELWEGVGEQRAGSHQACFVPTASSPSPHVWAGSLGHERADS